MPEQTRRWKFLVEDENGDCAYVGLDGTVDDESEWLGTDIESRAEAERRADAWESASNGLCLRVTIESRGVDNRSAIPAARSASNRGHCRGVR